MHGAVRGLLATLTLWGGGEEAVEEIRSAAAPLKGLRVLHLSVTAFGTGVAELLSASAPLLSNVGIECSWQVLRPAE